MKKMFEEHIFKTLYNSLDDKPFKLNVYFEDTCLFVTIIDSEKRAWRASVTWEFLHTLWQTHGAPPGFEYQLYYNTLKRYIRDSPPCVSYVLDEAHFAVYEEMPDNDSSMKIKYFFCNIQQVDYNLTIENLLENFYLDNIECEKKCEFFQKEYEVLQQSNTELRNKLQEYINITHTEEDDMYRNFVMVLNEKKRRIQHLSELLEAFRMNKRPKNPPPMSKKFKRKYSENMRQIKKVRPETVSASEPEDNTDDEEYKKIVTSEAKLYRELIKKVKLPKHLRAANNMPSMPTSPNATNMPSTSTSENAEGNPSTSASENAEGNPSSSEGVQNQTLSLQDVQNGSSTSTVVNNKPSTSEDVANKPSTPATTVVKDEPSTSEDIADKPSTPEKGEEKPLTPRQCDISVESVTEPGVVHNVSEASSPVAALAHHIINDDSLPAYCALPRRTATSKQFRAAVYSKHGAEEKREDKSKDVPEKQEEKKKEKKEEKKEEKKKEKKEEKKKDSDKTLGIDINTQDLLDTL